MRFSLLPAQSPAYPKLSGIRKNCFHAVDDQQGFGEVEVLPCSGRGDDEGEKAYHIDGRLCSGVVSFKVLLMSGVGTHSGLLLHTEDAGADFMETNERYHFIDIADDSFRVLTIASALDCRKQPSS